MTTEMAFWFDWWYFAETGEQFSADLAEYVAGQS